MQVLVYVLKCNKSLLSTNCALPTSYGIASAHDIRSYALNMKWRPPGYQDYMFASTLTTKLLGDPMTPSTAIAVYSSTFTSEPTTMRKLFWTGIFTHTCKTYLRAFNASMLVMLLRHQETFKRHCRHALAKYCYCCSRQQTTVRLHAVMCADLKNCCMREVTLAEWFVLMYRRFWEFYL